MSSHLERLMLDRIRQAGLPEPQAEFRFHPTRRWRFDFAWPEHKLALEVEGGEWVQGRHNRPQGFQEDLEKYQAAMVAGWSVYRVSGALVRSGAAVETLAKLLAKSKPQ